MRNLTNELVVAGAGPAGMMAAITAAGQGVPVLLIERNPILGKKLNITGKGRCNLSNNCLPEQIIKNTPRNGKFLYSCLHRFPPAQTIEFFEQNGLPTKTERGNRVFPASDKARDVTDALKALLRRRNVTVRQGRVTELLMEDQKIVGLRTESEQIDCKAVILATGGLSYPLTGSTGDGYRLATACGHTLIPTSASIVPLESDDPCCKRMQGLALKNVRVKAYDETGKSVYEDFGELLFTHFGLSGPVILSMSAHLREFGRHRYTASIDLKPALEEQVLDDRILRDFERYKNRAFGNSLTDLLPKAMIGEVVARTGIDPAQPVHSISREDRRRLLRILKDFRIELSGPRPIDEAVVTSGGVHVREVDPHTMQSKITAGLFFAGEILDVDAYTGGYNLQIAWSTGHAAGIAAAQYSREG